MMVRCTVYIVSISTFCSRLPPSLSRPVPSPPPAGALFKSTINAHRRKNLSVFGRNDVTFPSFKPISCPYGLEGHLLSPPASSAFSLPRSFSSAGPFPPPCPASSFSFFTAVSEVLLTGFPGRLAAMYRLFFPHGIYLPAPSITTMLRSARRPQRNKLPRHPLPASRRTHQTPWTIRNPTSLRDFRGAIIRYLQVYSQKQMLSLHNPFMEAYAFLYGYGKSPLPSAISHRRRENTTSFSR